MLQTLQVITSPSSMEISTRGVQFIVRKDESINDIKTLIIHDYGMEKEAIRIIKKGSHWIPGIQNGKNVNAYRKQPITFEITNKSISR